MPVKVLLNNPAFLLFDIEKGSKNNYGLGGNQIWGCGDSSDMHFVCVYIYICVCTHISRHTYNTHTHVSIIRETLVSINTHTHIYTYIVIFNLHINPMKIVQV